MSVTAIAKCRYRLSSHLMALDGNDYKELYGTFVTKDEILQINQKLGAIEAKVDVLIPAQRATDVLLQQDVDFKRQLRDSIEGIRKDIAEINSGEAEWVKVIKKDVDDLKAARVPMWVFIVIGWIISGLIAYFSRPHGP